MSEKQQVMPHSGDVAAGSPALGVTNPERAEAPGAPDPAMATLLGWASLKPKAKPYVHRRRWP